MALVDLGRKADTLSRNLSHGDQKLLDVALALVPEPRVLLLDEPTAGMGPEERWQMINTVHRLWTKERMTLVFIEHDMDIVFKIAETIRVLSYGQVLAEGKPEDVRRNPAVIEAYLGHSFDLEPAGVAAADGVSA
jgi:branched-chain amino acid transport system ATP-binding protein